MKRWILALMLLAGALAACGGESGGGGELPADPAELESFHMARACAGEIIAAAAPYVADDGVNPIALYEKSTVTDDYNFMFTSTTGIPEFWTTPVDGDFSGIELVGCLERTADSFVESCEYELDETEEVGILEAYDATYRFTLIAPQSGEVVAQETIDAPIDGCPSFAIFSSDNEVETRYGRPDDQLPALVQPFVAP